LAIVWGIIMVPLYLRFIPIDVYGAWLASGNILAWLSTMDPGLTSVLQQRIAVAYGKHDLQDVRAVLGGGLLIGAVVLLLAIIFGLACAHYLPSWINLSPSVDKLMIVNAFSLAVIGTSLMIFSFAITSINQGLQGSLGSGLISIGINAISLPVTVVLLYNNFGLFALAYNLIFAGVCSVVFQSVYLMWRVGSEKIGI